MSLSKYDTEKAGGGSGEPVELHAGMYMAPGGTGPLLLTPTDAGTVQLEGAAYVLLSASPLPPQFLSPTGLQLAGVTIADVQAAGAGSLRLSGQLYPMAVLNQYPPATPVGVGQVGGASPMRHGAYSDALGQTPIEEVVVDFTPALIVGSMSSNNVGQVDGRIDGVVAGEDLVVTATAAPVSTVQIDLTHPNTSEVLASGPSPLTLAGGIPDADRVYVKITVADIGLTPTTMTVGAVQGTRSNTAPPLDVKTADYDVEWLTNGTMAAPTWTFHLHEKVPEAIMYSTADPGGGSGWYVFNSVSTTPVPYGNHVFDIAECSDPSVTWTWRFQDGLTPLGTDDPFGNGQGWQLSVLLQDYSKSAAFRLPFD